MERSDECLGFCFGIIFSNHFFGFLFNLKCLSRLWLSWAPPPRLTPCLQQGWDPQSPPKPHPGLGVPPWSLHPWGARCQIHPSAPVAQGHRHWGRILGGVRWAGQGLLCRRKISWEGKALEESGRKKRSFLECPSSPEPSRSPFCGMWLLQDPGSAPRPTLPPWEGAGEFGWISPPSCFSSSARGVFYTLEWFLALPNREPWKCQGSERGWAEPPPAKL